MSRQDDIKKLLTNHTRRLQRLKEQQASVGYNTPPEILNEIEDIELEIEKLNTELREIENNVASLATSNTSTFNNVQGESQKVKPVSSNGPYLDENILKILYGYYQAHRGNHKMTLRSLIEISKAHHSEMIRYLYGLQAKGWINFELTERAESGLVWLTPVGIKVSGDL